MNCKYCGKELEGELEICPECEKEQVQQQEPEVKEIEVQEPEAQKSEVKETPKKKSPATVTVTVSLWKIIAATVVLVLLVVVLVFALIYGITGKLPYQLGAAATTAPTAGTAAPTEPAEPRTAEELGMTIEGICDRTPYAADDTTAAVAAGEEVATVGNYKLTNSRLQVFYWMEFSGFASDAAEDGQDLLTTYQLDVAKPFYQQLVINSVVTWEQFFLHNAMGSFWKYAALNTLADAADFQISDADKASLEGVPAQLEEDAKKEGFESAEAMIKDRIGLGCTVEDFVFYMELTARGDLYANQFQSTYVPTQEEIETFFELNADYYEYYGITKETPKPASVRHILLVPEGAQVDSSTNHITATDEQWAAGEKVAQDMLDAWVADGAKEEDFAALAKEHTTDPGSKESGGLYEDVIYGTMVETFNAWLFDESRKPGDYGIVKTDFGYHLMYYVSQSEQDAWLKQATADCMSSGYCLNTKLGEAMETNKLATVLDKVVLIDLQQDAVEQTTEPTNAAE